MPIAIKVREEVVLKSLEDYGFFYWAGNNAYWYVLNQHSANIANVELTLQVDCETREVRLVATNDHKKLPSIYSKQYTKDNYLTFEEELDSFSFYDSIYPYMIVRLTEDGIFYIAKPKRGKKDE